MKTSVLLILGLETILLFHLLGWVRDLVHVCFWLHIYTFFGGSLTFNKMVLLIWPYEPFITFPLMALLASAITAATARRIQEMDLQARRITLAVLIVITILLLPCKTNVTYTYDLDPNTKKPPIKAVS